MYYDIGSVSDAVPSFGLAQLTPARLFTKIYVAMTLLWVDEIGVLDRVMRDQSTADRLPIRTTLANAAAQG